MQWSPLVCSTLRRRLGGLLLRYCFLGLRSRRALLRRCALYSLGKRGMFLLGWVPGLCLCRTLLRGRALRLLRLSGALLRCCRVPGLHLRRGVLHLLRLSGTLLRCCRIPGLRLNGTLLRCRVPGLHLRGARLVRLGPFLRRTLLHQLPVCSASSA